MTTTPLEEDSQCTVCIVGGGLTGIYSAYLLAKAGVDVLLIEAQENIGLGTTAYSTGKLTIQHSNKYAGFELEEAKLYYQANQQAIASFKEQLPSSLFQSATSFVYTTTEDGKKQLQQEYNRYEQIGIEAFATAETELPIPVTLALGIKNETQIHPVEVLTFLAKEAQQAGARIYTSSRATTITEQFIELENGVRILFEQLLICSHYPITSLQRLYSSKLAINRSYLTAIPVHESLEGQYISIDKPVRTIRTASIHNTLYLLYGGSNHLAGTKTETAIYYDTFEKELQTTFHLSGLPTFYWSAQDVQTPDKIPYVGPLESDSSIYIATGYDKWGLSNSLVAGELLTSYIQKEDHIAKALYVPTRHMTLQAWQQSFKTAGFIGVEFLNGHLARMDAPKCTHLGCRTRWNEGDNTWDCPCHGSRFDEHGNVIEGPAVYPLKLKKKHLD
ncbi:FAD-dependent oxidoreductase [Lysinibacillus sp. KU-BSD001]|uniref:FAD-dependent oxidoreductase n=1 Tax=Lysinibacillus sp. KU-BSD001 TaxID=3141328 RepID=UPI0036E0B4BD